MELQRAMGRISQELILLAAPKGYCWLRQSVQCGVSKALRRAPAPSQRPHEAAEENEAEPEDGAEPAQDFNDDQRERRARPPAALFFTKRFDNFTKII